MKGRTSVIGLDALRARLDRAEGRCVAVIDARLAASEIVGVCERAVDETIAVDSAADVESVERLARTLADVDRDGCDRVGSVVAVGGGRTLDTVKLAVAASRHPDLVRRIRAVVDFGSLHVGDDVAHDVDVVAVPTTLGTGSEQSQSAVVDAFGGRLIVGSPTFRPAAAVMTPLASRGLPRDLVLAGVFEALCRAIGPASGAGATTDDLAIAMATRLAVLGEELLAIDDPGGPAGDDLRLEVARLSGTGHGGNLHTGRPSSSFPAWCITTECSWWAGVEKVAAMAAVLPAVWDRALAGDFRFGAPVAIERLWRPVAGVGDLPAGPVDGLRSLADRWHIEPLAPCTDPDTRDVVARRIHDRWSDAGHLGELDEADIATVLDSDDRRASAERRVSWWAKGDVNPHALRTIGT